VAAPPRLHSISKTSLKDNALVVATYGGQPNWHALNDVKSRTKDGELKSLDDDMIASVGFLTLQGDEELFALDGQHRLAGIKPERHHFLHPKWGPSDFGCKKSGDGHGLRRPRSPCVRPGAHSVLRQDSRKDLTPCRRALPFVSAGAHAPHSDETPGPTATRGSSHSARRLRSLAFLCSSKAIREGIDQGPL